jgi:hypothetical protein
MAQALQLMFFFIDNTRKDHYSIKPVINEMSDHDAQLIVINNMKPVVIEDGCLLGCSAV